MYTLSHAGWNTYAEDQGHYSAVRCIELGLCYEAVRVTHLKERPGMAEFVHATFFLQEYTEADLVEMLQVFEYETMDQFVSEINLAPDGFVYRADGSIDRCASPSWYIDYMLLASLMVELTQGRAISSERADKLAKSITAEFAPEEKVVLFDSFAYACPFFDGATGVNNGYGCIHEDCTEFEVDDDGAEHGCCHLSECPLGRPMEEGDLYVENVDKDGVEAGDVLSEYGEFIGGDEYLVVSTIPSATDESKSALAHYEKRMSRHRECGNE